MYERMNGWINTKEGEKENREIYFIFSQWPLRNDYIENHLEIF
jgi:hypothetical protein